MPIVDGQEMKNVKQLIDKLQADPSLGQCTLRAQTSWDGTFKSKVVPVPGFRGSGGECLYAEDLLELLAKCITYDVLGHGDAQDIGVEAATITVEGDIDFRGSAGLDVPAGFQKIRVDVRIGCEASGTAIERLADTVQRVSVIGQSLSAVSQTWKMTKQVAA